MSNQIHAAALNDRGTPVRLAPVARHGVRASRAWSGVGGRVVHGVRRRKISPPTPTGLFGWLFFAGRWCPPRTERQNRAFAAFLRSWWASAHEGRYGRMRCRSHDFHFSIGQFRLSLFFHVLLWDFLTGKPGNMRRPSHRWKTASRNGRISL